MSMVLWHSSFGIFVELRFRTNTALCKIWRVFLLSLFWAWLCTLRVRSARKNALLKLMLVDYYVYPQTAEETVYKIVFGFNYLSMQKLSFQNVLGRGATRGVRAEPSLLFLKNREKSLDFGERRTCLCPSLC